MGLRQKGGAFDLMALYWRSWINEDAVLTAKAALLILGN